QRKKPLWSLSPTRSACPCDRLRLDSLRPDRRLRGSQSWASPIRCDRGPRPATSCGEAETGVMAKKPADADYEVGYGRPPKPSRFQKGRSGNPRGRPRHVEPEELD